MAVILILLARGQAVSIRNSFGDAARATANPTPRLFVTRMVEQSAQICKEVFGKILMR
jgi:hypothetical protein